MELYQGMFLEAIPMFEYLRTVVSAIPLLKAFEDIVIILIFMQGCRKFFCGGGLSKNVGHHG